MSFSQTLQLTLRFAKYYLMAGNRHSLQAPFAFSLNEAVFRRDRKSAGQQAIEDLRAHLLKDQRSLKVLDFGAGFGGTVYKERKVSFITRNSAKPPRYARMLYRLVKHLKPATMVELGTSAGISALYQAMGNPEGRLITLEGCPETAKLARQNFEKFPHLPIELVQGSFDEVLPEVLNRIDRIDYLFIDGHHRLEPTLHYIQLCYPKLSADALIVVDDINWSAEMREAWKQLMADTRFTLTIDIFMMGLLFVSKDLSKENFVLRY